MKQELKHESGKMKKEKKGTIFSRAKNISLIAALEQTGRNRISSLLQANYV